jgi:hypothetical protein
MYALSKRHDISRQLTSVWIRTDWLPNSRRLRSLSGGALLHTSDFGDKSEPIMIATVG